MKASERSRRERVRCKDQQHLQEVWRKEDCNQTVSVEYERIKLASVDKHGVKAQTAEAQNQTKTSPKGKTASCIPCPRA